MALPKRHPETRPALRLIDTRKIGRADWLEVRKTGIGGSDAAAAVGLSPYKSPLELWMEKTGRDAALPKPDPKDTTHPTYWGTFLEPIVAAAYTQQTGNMVRKVNAVLQHPQFPFMLANLDREVVGTPLVQVLECKTAGEFGVKLWQDGVPEYVQLQVQHQLAVTGKLAADVAVLICGQRLEVHHIKRDDDLISRLITLEARFWQYVTSDTPPPADGSESADRALRVLYPEILPPWTSATTAGSRSPLPIWSICAPTSRPGKNRQKSSNKSFSRRWATRPRPASRRAACCFGAAETA